jgi:MFS family permease
MFKTIISGFAPLKRPNFRIYISGQAVSLIGTWLQITAQSWVVWELTHSEVSLGLVAMLSALPTLFLSPWAGVIADRSNRQNLLIFTQFGMMCLAFILAYLVGAEIVQLWHVYVLALFSGLFSALDFPAQQAFLGDLAGMGEVRKAVNMNAMFFQASRMIGPALAGWVIAQWGASLAFWLNGISFLAVIGSLLLVKANVTKKAVSENSVLKDIWEGMKFLRSQPRIQDLLLMSICITGLALSLMTMMPAFAAEQIRGDATTLGSLLAASGAGALISVVIIAPIVQSKKRVGYLMSLSIIWAGVWISALSFTTWLPLAMLCLFALSFSLPLVIAMSMGLIQVLAPPEMRARLLSLFTMISFGLQPLSSILVGNAAERFSVGRVALFNGTVLVLAGFSLIYFRKGLKDWQVTNVHKNSPSDNVPIHA